MPVISCPKCKGKLRLADDSPARRIKCPTCGNVFLSSDGVDGKSPAGPSTANRAKPSRAADAKDNFELPLDDGDRPRRSREDDDDRDRGRRSRRRDEDDDRESGRSRRRFHDDDEVDDEFGDRPRRSRRRDDDDDGPPRRRQYEDDYDDRSRRFREDPRAIEGQVDRASLACLLNFIAGWLQVGAFGLMVFIVFLSWCGLRDGLNIFSVIAGLLGLGYFLTSATGLGFLVSGPRKHGALGLSIATAAVAGLHLIMLIIIATNRNWGGFGNAFIDRTAEVHWDAFVTQLRALPSLLFVEIGLGDRRMGISDGSLLPIMTNLAEIARMILFLMTLRAVMLCVRDSKAASTCMKAMVGFAIGAGSLVVVGMLFGMLLLAVRPNAVNRDFFESFSAIWHLYHLVLYMVLAGLMLSVTLIVRSVKNRLDYR